MARYRIVVRKSVSKDLDRISKKDARRIIKAIGTLADDPRPSGSKKLWTLRPNNSGRSMVIQATSFTYPVISVGSGNGVLW